MQDIFARMTLYNLASLLRLHASFMQLKGDLEALSGQIGMQINIMHEDIFNSMHRI